MAPKLLADTANCQPKVPGYSRGGHRQLPKSHGSIAQRGVQPTQCMLPYIDLQVVRNCIPLPCANFVRVLSSGNFGDSGWERLEKESAEPKLQ